MAWYKHGISPMPRLHCHAMVCTAMPCVLPLQAIHAANRDGGLDVSAFKEKFAASWAVDMEGIRAWKKEVHWL